MKTKQSIKNSVISMIQYTIIMLIGFISQKIFINILGTEYLGLNGLFTNIISMLGIVELGIGSAIIYNLYKPIVNNDYTTINSLMKFYKKAYFIISIIIFVLGLCFIPFLPHFVGKVTIKINIILIYLLFLLDIVASYFLSYKRSMLYADQKNYIISLIHIVIYTLLNIFQLVFLYFTKNYYVYLVIKIIFRLIENIIITIYVNKKYKNLNVKNAENLDKNILDDIVKKIKALFFHKIGTFIILGTDNIIISRYLGLVVVGLYSNYYLIINALELLFGEAINSLTPSVGHLLVENDIKKNYDVFKKIRFINFWIATFTGIGLLILVQPFITIWLGAEYLLSLLVLITLVINYYKKMMRYTYSAFKNAAGIYYEDRFIPLLESLTNIAVSILLVNLIGLPGVFIGTIMSSLCLWCYSYPKFVYKSLFNRSYKSYIKETIQYFVLFLIVAVVTYIISSNIVVNNNFLQLIIDAFCVIIIPNVIIFALFRNTENYKYFKSLLIKLLKEVNMKRFKLILIIIWMIVIFMLSNQPADKSGDLSNGLINNTIVRVYEVFNGKVSDEKRVEILEKYGYPVRKLAHFTEYFILGILCYIYFYGNTHAFIYSLILCFVYACTDEFHQYFVDGRYCSIIDVFIDSFGSLVSLCIYKCFKNLQNIKKCV